MIQPEKLSIRFLPSGRTRLDAALRELGVDPYGIRVMLPKGLSYCIHVGPVSYPAAAILKQEMLSLGGECAIPRSAITGKIKATYCILIGTSSHLSRLREKLRRQPFGLSTVAEELSVAIAHYEKKDFALDLRGRKLKFGRRPRIMGIINITPDSFSGDGMLKYRIQDRDPGAILEYAQKMVASGADIIDIGGESSRPGAQPVSRNEELARIIPAVKVLAKKLRVPVSVDTYKAEVARRALENGCAVINDITGLRDPAMARVCAAYACGVVIMHMKGTPATMKRCAHYGSLMHEMHAFFRGRMAAAFDAGITPERIILDPGIGFAKDWRQNVEILANLAQFKSLGRPLLVGVSRKSFIGTILNGALPEERLSGSLAACVVAAANGAAILRVHDVKETVEAVTTACALFNS
jgi:dihydropteroate synthase